MANPYLPSWEYIPDGEPRVFGDSAGSDSFCDYKLKIWSAPDMPRRLLPYTR